MKISRIMIAAPKSGSGKTTLTCALLQALKNQGENVISYKCGPDYIDPLFHKKAIGVPARNLDTFFTDEKETRKLFAQSVPEGGLAVIEGVMGLFDGLGGIQERGSSYHLAKVTGTPIVLVADVKGMGRSMIAMLAGFLAYDTENLIRGVILNRISQNYFKRMKPLIEDELNLTVLGYLPEQPAFHMESRHLGLILPDELVHIKEKLQLVAKSFSATVSVEDIRGIAAAAEELDIETELCPCRNSTPRRNSPSIRKAETSRKPAIAVARDEAFCFYYMENLQILQEYGAELIYFSPLHDEQLPQDCHGILLGGGYPELYAARLCENKGMLAAIRQAVNRGLPIVAECGGFLYLHTTMCDKEGNEHTMAGIVPGACFYTGRSVRFGYLEIQGKQGHFLAKRSRIRGHEFHYYDSTANGKAALAIKPVTGETYPCIMEGETYWLGFPHLYYPSNPAFAEAFVAKARKYQDRSSI